jgi:hypothetical protein
MARRSAPGKSTNLTIQRSCGSLLLTTKNPPRAPSPFPRQHKVGIYLGVSS